MEERGQQEGIKLIDVPDQLAVDLRKRRIELGDADREPLVEQLVRHHVPVDDAAREHGQDGPEREPEGAKSNVDPATEGGGPLSKRVASHGCRSGYVQV